MPLHTTTKMLASSCLAMPIVLALTSTAAPAQYYAPVIVYPYYVPPTAYRYYARPPAFQYYAPPIAYYGPYVLYYPGNPVKRFWSRQDRYRN
jgi:hypothetical protein